MHKYRWFLLLFSPWLQAEPSAAVTPQQVLLTIQPRAQARVVIDQWQQAPARVGGSYLATGSAAGAAGDESEINLTFSWNSQTNRQYLAALGSGLTDRQAFALRYVTWQLAGELRREWANLARLTTLVDCQQLQVEQLLAMLSRTQAAFAAREITRIDLLLVENALTGAQQQLAASRAQLDVAHQAYQQLSGHTQWPMHWQESVRATDWQQHPWLLLQHQEVLLAESAYVRDSGGANEPWETGIVLRQTQGIGTLPDDTAIGVQIALPFGASSGTEQSVLAQQQMHQQQQLLAEVTRQVRTTWFAAKAQLSSSEIALKSTNEQWRRAREIQAAADAALKSGEMSHTEWLRLFLHHHQFDQNARLASVAVAAAVAEFNQAGGLTW